MGQIQLHAMLVNSFQETFVAKKVHVSHYGAFLSKKFPIAAITPPHPTPASARSQQAVGTKVRSWVVGSSVAIAQGLARCPPFTHPWLCTLALPSTRRDSQGSSLTTSTWLQVSTPSGIAPITAHGRSCCCGMSSCLFPGSLCSGGRWVTIETAVKQHGSWNKVLQPCNTWAEPSRRTPVGWAPAGMPCVQSQEWATGQS